MYLFIYDGPARAMQVYTCAVFDGGGIYLAHT